MNEYSMPRYFQNMEKIGDAAFAYDAENEKVLKDAEAEIARRIEEVLESGKATEALNESGQLSAMQRIIKLSSYYILLQSRRLLFLMLAN